MYVAFNGVDFDLEITFGIVLVFETVIWLKSLMLLSIENTSKLSELARKFSVQRLILAFSTFSSIVVSQVQRTIANALTFF